jgi:1,4-alpha-glucan branching enzyme
MEMQKESKNTDLAAYLFHQGTNYRSQDYMGVHRAAEGYTFRVFAPHATAVYVIGAFNRWEDTLPMTRITENGVWEACLDADRFGEGELYKFKLVTPHGVCYKADPYARRTGTPPETASVYTDTSAYVWQDEGWMSYRHRAMAPAKQWTHPINIYELHLGSWMRHADGQPYTYTETARELIPYVKQMGYTHIQLMPIMEHPSDASMGYCVTSFFAPTARYGTPQDFMAFVDALHAAGVGVILDFATSRIPQDAHGLFEFDGEPLYEQPAAARAQQASLGLDFSRREVQCLWISCIGFWAETYHIDGFYVDAGLPGKGESQEFWRRINTMMSVRHADVLMIAGGVSEATGLTSHANNGPGFSMRTNDGFANDVLQYHAISPSLRANFHKNVTFSLMYTFREHYLLPISHNAVTAGQRSLLDRVPGDYLSKFAASRALLGYMMTHPGKKLMFMGCEIGQFREWNWREPIEWFLLEYDQHAAHQRYVAELNHLYLSTPALYEIDDSWKGFRWIDADNAEQSVLSYRRIDSRGREVIVVVNFADRSYENYSIGVPDPGVYEEIFNSDAIRFGGEGRVNDAPIRTRPERLHQLPDTLNFTLPPLSVLVFRCRRRQPRVRK